MNKTLKNKINKIKSRLQVTTGFDGVFLTYPGICPIYYDIYPKA